MSETNEVHDDRFHDDQRLTAYALGELSGDDLREIEALLASNEAARRAVDEIRATASLVAAELGTAGGEALTADQRGRIASRAAAPTNVVPVRRLYWTAAAALIVGATAGAATTTLWMAPRTSARDVAKGDGDIRTRFEKYYDVAIDEPAPDPAKTPGTTTYRIAGNNGRPAQPPSEPTDLSTSVGGAGGGSGGGNGTPGLEGGKDRSSSGWNERDAPPSPPPMPSAAQPKIEDGKKSTAPEKPQSRTSSNPAEPPPPPDASGPATPGGGGGPSTGGGGAPRPKGGVAPSGPTTGGPDAGRLNTFADYHRLTPAQKKAVEELFKSEASMPKEEFAVKLRCISFELDGTITADGIAGLDGRATANDSGTAAYSHIEDNPFRLVKDAPLSTFGADVDTASYSNVRRFLNSGRLPPPGAVRIEEMVNYFPYDYAPPTNGGPFAVRVDVAGCPWKTDHRLVRIGIKGKVVESAARPAANLVFLLDVSGSMQPIERLPLIVRSMKLLVEKLEARDRVAIVVYAGASGLALPSTSCEEKGKILAALDSLRAGGSTNGAAGIQLAYDVAMQNRIEGGVNRVILATDGDFNVGVSDESSLVQLIEEKRKTGVFLSVLGVGTDNFKDAQMEKLADKGNGAFAYIDTLKEGQKVLVEQTQGTLLTIAKDVKFQIEFNPAQVGSWRLIGYENRVLAAEDFKDDAKDAGEIGAGHTVTALYELVPTGVLTRTAGVEPLKYQQPPAPTGASSYELLTVKLRWKEPNSDVSTPMEVPVIDEGLGYSSASPDFKFAASVAAFGMCLRGSPHRGETNLPAVVELATEGAANDPGGYRGEFVELVKRAMQLGAK